jgi:hypothetical protein
VLDGNAIAFLPAASCAGLAKLKVLSLKVNQVSGSDDAVSEASLPACLFTDTALERLNLVTAPACCLL